MSTDYDYSKYTPLDSTGIDYDVFKSAYKNIRFALPTAQKHSVTDADMANLPGISYLYYGDVSLWRIILYFNGLTDALQDVYPGMTLNIAAKSDIINYVSKQQNNSPMNIII
jgi:hypothetical protein